MFLVLLGGTLISLFVFTYSYLSIYDNDDDDTCLFSIEGEKECGFRWEGRREVLD